jgi:hypothetical protein
LALATAVPSERKPAQAGSLNSPEPPSTRKLWLSWRVEAAVANKRAQGNGQCAVVCLVSLEALVVRVDVWVAEVDAETRRRIWVRRPPRNAFHQRESHEHNGERGECRKRGASTARRHQPMACIGDPTVHNRVALTWHPN